MSDNHYEPQRENIVLDTKQNNTLLKLNSNSICFLEIMFEKAYETPLTRLSLSLSLSAQGFSVDV